MEDSHKQKIRESAVSTSKDEGRGEREIMPFGILWKIKASLGTIAEAAVTLERKQSQLKQTKDALLPLADLCAEQCLQPIPNPLTISTKVCENSQTLQTTGVKTFINESYKDYNQHVCNLHLDLCLQCNHILKI